ncbi:unnamed protein product [Cylicocyclus nassatus]|uniref:Peptidase S1 domain-containing protein n=1 Tax=Cylicocyclus nassatus TaxID=53992 RepID=A0AA36GX82_CYLNA|nr:unnamed protein product [Cylicocyclus nassatus]
MMRAHEIRILFTTRDPSDDATDDSSEFDGYGDEDDDDFMQQKIMGGERVEKGEIPWAVLLIFPGNLCGGTLISRRHILTAAHCFTKEGRGFGNCSVSNMLPMDSVKKIGVFVGGTCIRAGTSNCTSGDTGERHKIARAYYKGYFERGCKGTHDIAVLELSEDVSAAINHICLPFMDQVMEIEDPYLKLKSFGWGLDPLNFPQTLLPMHLQKLDSGSMMSEKKCSRLKIFEAKDTFCTNQSKDKHICIGDSGGGVTAKIEGRYYLIGIHSYGTDCGKVLEAKLPAVQINTDVSYYKTLIKSWIQL